MFLYLDHMQDKDIVDLVSMRDPSKVTPEVLEDTLSRLRSHFNEFSKKHSFLDSITVDREFLDYIVKTTNIMVEKLGN